MLGFGATGAGAIVGLVIGIGLSVYVAVVDMRKRAAGIRVRAQYQGSLVVVPAILAGVGALVGMGLARAL
jgi:ABC-type antimicrobial peptide transport system permease subunit